MVAYGEVTRRGKHHVEWAGLEPRLIWLEFCARSAELGGWVAGSADADTKLHASRIRALSHECA
jgi:hypothetical protein